MPNISTGLEVRTGTEIEKLMEEASDEARLENRRQSKLRRCAVAAGALSLAIVATIFSATRGEHKDDEPVSGRYSPAVTRDVPPRLRPYFVGRSFCEAAGSYVIEALIPLEYDGISFGGDPVDDDYMLENTFLIDESGPDEPVTVARRDDGSGEVVVQRSGERTFDVWCDPATPRPVLSLEP